MIKIADYQHESLFKGIGSINAKIRNIIIAEIKPE